jgi:hypothetical protein
MFFPAPCIPHPASSLLAVISQKSRLIPKLDQSHTNHSADYWDAKPERSRLGSRQDAVLAIHPLACKEASMARANLRIYRGPETKTPVRPASTPATVTVNVGEVLPLLADAIASERTWLSDFENDEITITADLYEVLLAYQYYRHPAA